MKSQQKESFLPPLWIITVATFLGFLWILSELKELVVLLIVGYTIAFVIDPWLDWLERKKIRREIGFFLVVLSFALAALLLLLLGIPPLAEEFQRVTSLLPQMIDIAKQRLIEAIEWVSSRAPISISVDSVRQKLSSLPDVGADTVQRVLSGIGAFLLQGYSLTLTLINLTLLPFIVYYLAVDLDRFHGWIRSIIPSPSRKKWEKISQEINGYVRAFVSGQCTVAFVLFVLYAIGFWFLEFKQWMFLAAIAGLGNVIPYVGTILGFVLATLLSLMVFGETSHLLWTWAIIAVVQFLEGTFITPRIVGNKVGLSPLLVILALFAGGKLFGLLGVFLAIPAAACFRVLASHTYRNIVSRHRD